MDNRKWQKITGSDTELIILSATNAFDTKLEKINTSLIAVQGPKAASILQTGTSEDLSDIFFMQGTVFVLSSLTIEIFLIKVPDDLSPKNRETYQRKNVELIRH